MKFSIVAAVLAFAMPAFAADYEVDPGHSSVSFTIRHLVSKTKGQFDKFGGDFSYEKGKSDSWKVEAWADANSINTNEAKRDKHLRSPDFFDTAKYPKLLFKSTKVEYVGSEKSKLHGDLTLHGVTKPVVFDLEATGEGTDPWGNQVAGFTATAKVNRKDFGLVWNKALEAGGFLVGDDVNIALEIEGRMKQVKKAKK